MSSGVLVLWNHAGGVFALRLWTLKREDGRAQLARLSLYLFSLAGSVGDSDGFAQVGGWSFVIVFHPSALSSGVMRFARARSGRSGFLANRFWFERHLAPGDRQILPFAANGNLPRASLLNAYSRLAQARTNVVAGDLIDGRVKANRVVAGNDTLLHRAKNCSQIMCLAETPVRIVSRSRDYGELRFPLRQILGFQMALVLCVPGERRAVPPAPSIAARFPC